MADALNVRLDPGVAFGTGSHPLRAYASIGLTKTSSPPIAFLITGAAPAFWPIGAKKLGAAEVCGTDIDPQAVEAARDNAIRNDVEAQSGCRPTCLKAHSQSWSPTFWPIR